jgi:hypothetical protein
MPVLSPESQFLTSKAWGEYSFQSPYLLSPNRKNAQHCTGPKTEKGKEKSSQNALKTGLDAKSEVLRFESRPDYEALIAEFYARYHPTVPEDRALVDMLISSEWLTRRYMSIDTAVWEHEFFRSGETSLGATFLKSQQAFERVGRRINWAQRNYQLALKQLLEIRAKRAAEPEPEADIQEPTPEPPNPEPEAATPLAETESLNPKLVSFLPDTPQTPEIVENSSAHDPEPEENPPAAA